MPTLHSTPLTLPSGHRYTEIILDYPERLNVIGQTLMVELQQAVSTACREPDNRLIILSGGGDKAFIGGADINEMLTLTPAGARQFITTLHQTCQTLREAPVPLIARINGYCLGAGLEIAAACDIRIAADNACFGMPEVRVGIPSVIEAALLPQLIGWGRTRWLLFSGNTIDSRQALQWGLIEQCAGAEELAGVCRELATAIALAGPGAIRAQKALIQFWETAPLDKAIAQGIDTFEQSFHSDEPRSMMTQFLHRKKT